VEFEFVVEMNLVQMGTNEFFPQLIRLAANERHLQSRPYSNQKLGRRDQSAASSRLLNSSCPSRGDLFPPILVMEAAENHASHNLAVLVIRTEIGREVSAVILRRRPPQRDKPGDMPLTLMTMIPAQGGSQRTAWADAPGANLSMS
jgi:hypothetical protein